MIGYLLLTGDMKFKIYDIFLSRVQICYPLYPFRHVYDGDIVDLLCRLLFAVCECNSIGFRSVRTATTIL